MFFADPCHPLHWIRPKIHSVVFKIAGSRTASFGRAYPSSKNIPLFLFDFFCQIDSVRDADEHPTSRQIDSIRKASDFSSEERLEKASSVYEAWRKKNCGSTATVVLDCGKDCEYPTVRLGDSTSRSTSAG